jgi:hypothetical protein
MGHAKLTLAAVAAALTFASGAAPAGASAAPVSVSSLSLSTGCARPGASVTATVTISDGGWWPTWFYAQAWVTYLGQQVYRSDALGSFPAVPFYPETESQTVQVPWYAPWGTYYVNVAIGGSASTPTEWDQKTASVSVSPFC